MSDLLGSLSSAARALDAQRLGLDVVGQNIANINTPGYTRRTLELAAVAPVDSLSAGGGVDVVRIHAQRADLIEAQLRREQPAQGREAAVAESLAQVETTLGTPGASLDGSLTRFFDAFSQLAQDPTSDVARQQVVVQGQSLAVAFNDLAGRLEVALQDADAGVRASVDQINALADRVASLNAAIAGAGSTNTETLRDEQGVALESLSELIDISVVSRADGGSDVSIGNGRALVIGENAYEVGVAAGGIDGLADLLSGSTVITSEVTGGRVGGLLHVRDVLLPDYTSRLDDLAFGVATSVNAVHADGFDLDGNAGGDFFAPLAAASGAAETLAMNAAVVDDTRLIAAAASTAAGDNENARALASLRQTTIPGGTANPVDTWGALVYRVAIDAQVARNEQESREEIVRQLETLRDQVSGVSLDEEAANLMKFQRAYEANARFFSAVDHSLDMLMQMIGT